MSKKVARLSSLENSFCRESGTNGTLIKIFFDKIKKKSLQLKSSEKAPKKQRIFDIISIFSIAYKTVIENVTDYKNHCYMFFRKKLEIFKFFLAIYRCLHFKKWNF